MTNAIAKPTNNEDTPKSHRHYKFGTFDERLAHLCALLETDRPEIVYEDGDIALSSPIMAWTKEHNISLDWLFVGSPSAMLKLQAEELKRWWAAQAATESPVIALFNEWQRINSAAHGVSEAECGKAVELMDDIEAKMMPLPIADISDLAAKLIVHTADFGSASSGEHAPEFQRQVWAFIEGVGAMKEHEVAS